MAVFKCKMCGGELALDENLSVGVCPYCDTTQTFPSVDNEKKVALFNRANNLRLKNEFDKAAGIYESIVSEFSDDAEAFGEVNRGQCIAVIKRFIFNFLKPGG